MRHPPMSSICGGSIMSDPHPRRYTDIRANVIEGLLDPSLMRVEVTDTSPLPDQPRAA
jgi:hypothetical protein